MAVDTQSDLLSPDDFKYSAHQIRALYEQSERIGNQKEGEICLVDVDTRLGPQKIILKIRDSCIDCMEHEYNVGLRLNGLHRHLINSYGLYFMKLRPNRDEQAVLLLEYAEGEKLCKFAKKLTRDGLCLLFYHILLIIADIQSKVEFTHYDLHFGNIIVDWCKETTYTYTAFGKTYQIRSPFFPRIIDYGYSHAQGVIDDWIEVSRYAIIGGAICSVYDDFFDYSNLITKCMYYLNCYDDSINYMLEKNKFLPFRGDRSDKACHYMGKEPIRILGNLPDSEIYQKPFWSSSVGKNQHPLLLIERYERKKKRRELPRDSKKKFAQKIGESLRYIKDKRISDRQFSSLEIFTESARFLITQCNEKMPVSISSRLTEELSELKDRCSSSQSAVELVDESDHAELTKEESAEVASTAETAEVAEAVDDQIAQSKSKHRRDKRKSHRGKDVTKLEGRIVPVLAQKDTAKTQRMQAKEENQPLVEVKTKTQNRPVTSVKAETQIKAESRPVTSVKAETRPELQVKPLETKTAKDIYASGSICPCCGLPRRTGPLVNVR